MYKIIIPDKRVSINDLKKSGHELYDYFNYEYFEKILFSVM